MKKLIFLLAFIVSGQLAWSQMGETDYREAWQFGLKLGANYSNVYSESGEDFRPNSKLGIVAGLTGMMPINKYVGLQPELLFSQKGFNATGSLLGSSYDFTRTTTILDIPLLLVLKPSEFFSVMAGPQYSFVLKQRDVFENGGSSIEQEDTFSDESYRKQNFGFVAGLEVNVEHVVVGLRVGIDALHNRAKSNSLTPRYKNVWYQATVGYRFF